ncbi:MAG: MBL fold metallo-hydrolase, partial [Rhodomicrobium sp.]
MEVRPEGLYCKAGDFFIDPVRPVSAAVVTHGHSDHARAGHVKVVATPDTIAIMACRFGEGFAQKPIELPYAQAMHCGDARVTFYPAGHILGSAQVLIEHGGARLVVSGDYKRTADLTAREFELVPCDVFVTEATFGLPVFCHPDPQAEIEKLLTSLAIFPG